jgi:hypothetical protein
MKTRTPGPLSAVREARFHEARLRVLRALLRNPLTGGQMLNVLRGSGYCLPNDRDEMVDRLVERGEIVLDPQARREALGLVVYGRAYRLTAGKCRVCGCTDLYGCEVGCEWVEPDLCSACVEG